jgi:DNA-binding transcriptional MerR regulator/methylmalonyl-CoA mutase cobalamin-binding subunit
MDEPPAVPRKTAKSRQEATYSLGAVVRLTGLSDHVLRAWERRYEAVRPQRTEGGTRRYRESDVERLRLLAAAVENGHPIGDIAQLPDAELRRRVEEADAGPRPPLRAIVDALERLDAEAVERLLGMQLAALGGRRFLSSVVEPLLERVGDLWEKGGLCVASEHLASTAVRNLLGGALRRVGAALQAPPILFTTLSGDRHELGALACAVVAAELGANAIYLGPDLPPGEIVTAARSTRAAVVAVGVSRYAPVRQREKAVRELHAALPRGIALWVGGAGSGDLRLPQGAEHVEDVDALERKVSLVAFRPAQPPS